MTTGVQMEVADASSLADKAVFFRVSFGVLGNERKIKQDVIKDSIGHSYGPGENSEALADDGTQITDACKERLKATKYLLESDELEAIRKADRRVKAEVIDLCLPAPIQGSILVPHGQVDRVFNILNAYKTVERPALIKTFVNAYPDLCARAKATLGPLYIESDYVSPDKVSQEFTMIYNIVNFGPSGKLKSISPAMYKAASENADKIMVEAAAEARQMMRAVCLKLVTNLKAALQPDEEGNTKRLRAATLGNLQEFVNNFDVKNVTDDAELTALKDKLKDVICGTNTEQLKSSDTFRESVLADLADVTGKLSTMVENVPGRVFKDIE